MRVNIYDEEITDRVEIVKKSGRIGVRIYLYLPVTHDQQGKKLPSQVRGKFEHRPGDDDSAAVTLWSKEPAKLRRLMQKAVAGLDDLAS